MSECREWRDALMDCALGQAPTSGLEAHLATCADCAAALKVWREKAALLSGVTLPEPRPGGPERALLRIAQDAERLPYLRLAVATLVLLICIVALTFQDGRPRAVDPRRIAALSAWRSPTASLLPPPGALAGVPHLGRGLLDMNAKGDSHAR